MECVTYLSPGHPFYDYLDLNVGVMKCGELLQVFGLGFVSTFDQVLDGLPEEEQKTIFDAYIRALDEEPSKYRADAQRLETWAAGLGSPDGLKPNASGDDVQRDLEAIAVAAKDNKFFYSKFFAIGLFR